MPPTSPPLLEICDLELSLGGRKILQDINLSLHAGEIVSLIGPNGAGKTSLLRVILGLVPASHGEVKLRPDLRIGFMPQRLVVDDVLPLTVARFITLGRRAPGPRLHEVLRTTGIDALANSPVQRISGGEMQRAILARALLHDPHLLILDEPAQGVDVVGQAEIYNLLGKLRNEHGCGILLVSHDLHMVMAKTDRVICLNHHICCSGHPETVTRDPAYHTLFGGELPAGLALYHHHHDHSHNLHGEIVAPPHEAD